VEYSKKSFLWNIKKKGERVKKLKKNKLNCFFPLPPIPEKGSSRKKREMKVY
jgi:hypothetical protein